MEGLTNDRPEPFRPIWTAEALLKMKEDLGGEKLRIVTSKHLSPDTILLMPEGPIPLCLTEEEVSAYWKRCCVLRLGPDKGTMSAGKAGTS